jgi:hypothetical protein
MAYITNKNFETNDGTNILKIYVENEKSEQNTLVNNSIHNLYRKSKRLTTISDMGIAINYIPPDGVVDYSDTESSITSNFTNMSLAKNNSIVDMSISQSDNDLPKSTVNMTVNQSDTELQKFTVDPDNDLPKSTVDMSVNQSDTELQKPRGKIIFTEHYASQAIIDKIKSFNASYIPLQRHENINYVYDSLSDIIRELTLSNLHSQNTINSLREELHVIKNRLSSVELEQKNMIKIYNEDRIKNESLNLANH